MINKGVKTLQGLEQKIGAIAKLDEIKNALSNIIKDAGDSTKDKLKKLIDNI